MSCAINRLKQLCVQRGTTFAHFVAINKQLLMHNIITGVAWILLLLSLFGDYIVSCKKRSDIVCLILSCRKLHCPLHQWRNMQSEQRVSVSNGILRTILSETYVHFKQEKPTNCRTKAADVLAIFF